MPSAKPIDWSALQSAYVQNILTGEPFVHNQYISPYDSGLLGGLLNAGTLPSLTNMLPEYFSPPTSVAEPAERRLRDHFSSAPRSWRRPRTVVVPAEMIAEALSEMERIRRERDRAQHQRDQQLEALQGVPQVQVHAGCPPVFHTLRADTVEQSKSTLVLKLDGAVVASYDRSAVRGWQQVGGGKLKVTGV